ncbi:hypothetical protein [Shimia sp. SDUM112013]|uniref:hypothetical protein n=1 Tax=Shimia sp. SDUM112013 TaxID=3136160 RepID=UPI0032EF4506
MSLFCLRHYTALLLTSLLLLCAVPAKAEGFSSGANWTPAEAPDTPTRVGIAIQVDQITFIDQQAENFGIVATLILRFNDPRLGFEVAPGGETFRTMPLDAFVKLAGEKRVNLPAFILKNQQGRRFAQQEIVIQHSHGDVMYLERFSATLQAPHFNFRKYPFDTQKFFVEVLSVLPADYYEFYPLDDLSGLGDMLGEEEWVPYNARMASLVTAGATGLETTQVQLSFEAHRHIQYYALRILLPLLIILFVSWATFFLEEYRRRIDMANANLLVFVAFNFAISTTLPRLGYLTFMDSLLVGMFIITGSMVLVNIALRRLKLNDREVLARKIDRYLVIWVYPLMYAGFLFWAIRFFMFSGN